MKTKVILSIIATLLFVGGVAFVLKQKTLIMKSVQINESKSESLASVNTWKTYKNEEYKFEYQLPEEWVLDDASLIPNAFYFKTKEFKPVLLGYAPSLENEPIYSTGEISVWVSDNPQNQSIKDRYLRYDDMSRLLFVDPSKRPYKETKIHGNDFIEFEPYWYQNPNESFGAYRKDSILKLDNYIIQFEYIYERTPDSAIEENLRKVIESFKASTTKKGEKK